METNVIVHNEDIREIVTEIPEGHKHVRTTLVFQDGKSMTFQEATIANLVRSYIDVKTHPVRRSICLKGSRLQQVNEGFADWQLIED